MEWTVAIGVDTHRGSHLAVALDRLGRELDQRSVLASEHGYGELLAWAESFGRCCFAIEGAASYGAGLARFLAARGLPVFECERPSRRDRRQGKNDPLDALLAARRLLAGAGLSVLRGGGAREPLRALLVERRGADQARTACLNQLHALAITAPSSLRDRLEGLHDRRLAAAAARLRQRRARSRPWSRCSGGSGGGRSHSRASSRRSSGRSRGSCARLHPSCSVSAASARSALRS